MKELTRAAIKRKLKERRPSSHKGDHGHVLLIAGKVGAMGAAIIAARACLRSGAGLLTANIPSSERIIIQTGIPEAMVAMRENGDLDLDRYAAVCIGPGLGTDQVAKDLVLQVLAQYKKPILLDADALNIIASNRSLMGDIPGGSILTPHPREFDRLFGDHESEAGRAATSTEKAAVQDVVIVLKGQHTRVTFAGETCVNTTGNAGLAKGGSGDALAGIIAALLAQGYDSFSAAQCGVHLHGLAADIALEKQSVESMLSTDVIECLGQAFNQVRSHGG